MKKIRAKKVQTKKKTPKPNQKLTFQSEMENIAKGMEYYALSVPAKITEALGTHGPVPVMARVNGSEEFLVSLHPIGGGRHYLRVRNQICKSVDVKTGDKVRVQITVRDRTDEIEIPKDLAKAIRDEDLTEAFNSLPIGKKSFMLRKLKEAAKPETRQKRIQEIIEEAHGRREKR